VKRLSEQDWIDVADLCEQGASSCECGYDDHTQLGKEKAAEWLRKLAMNATYNAMDARLRESKLPSKT
jgi:hypothetical protein